jgi:hypothetical protein
MVPSGVARPSRNDRPIAATTTFRNTPTGNRAIDQGGMVLDCQPAVTEPIGSRAHRRQTISPVLIGLLIPFRVSRDPSQ